MRAPHFRRSENNTEREEALRLCHFKREKDGGGGESKIVGVQERKEEGDCGVPESNK